MTDEEKLARAAELDATAASLKQQFEALKSQAQALRDEVAATQSRFNVGDVIENTRKGTYQYGRWRVTRISGRPFCLQVFGIRVTESGQDGARGEMWLINADNFSLVEQDARVATTE